MTRARYAGFLRGTLSVLTSLEPAIARWLPEAMAPSRVAHLRADLAALDALSDSRTDARDAQDATALAGSRAAGYGAAYVVEGSTLGGMVLAERYEAALALPPGQATTFLRLRGRDTAKHWRGFLDGLARADADMTEAERDAACAAAAGVFDAYAHAMRAHGAIA